MGIYGYVCKICVSWIRDLCIISLVLVYSASYTMAWCMCMSNNALKIWRALNIAWAQLVAKCMWLQLHTCHGYTLQSLHSVCVCIHKPTQWIFNYQPMCNWKCVLGSDAVMHDFHNSELLLYQITFKSVSEHTIAILSTSWKESFVVRGTCLNYHWTSLA